MQNDPRLERYLTTLESALKAFPVSDRAEIITEIKSHALAALERDPQTPIDSILAALGEPETVANRYLLERGLKPTKPSIHPIVKWIVIGFLSTFAMMLVFAGFVLTRVHSLVKIDDDGGHVQVLNGLVDIGGTSGPSFSGSTVLKPGQSVAVRFTSGAFQLKTSGDGQLSWDCRGRGPISPLESGGAVNLDFTNLPSAKCAISAPDDVKVTIEGQTGKIALTAPRFDIDAKLRAGKVSFEADDEMAYKFDVGVDRGKKDAFESSPEPNAHVIAIHVVNGKIQNAD